MSNLRYPQPYKDREYVWDQWSRKRRTQNDIAKAFGCPVDTIRRICTQFQDEGRKVHED